MTYKAAAAVLLLHLHLFFFFFLLSTTPIEAVAAAGEPVENRLVDVKRLAKFVDELPDMPRIRTYAFRNGIPVTKPLTIGMFQKTWRFHRDLPPTRVFAYGATPDSATVPGPTIESLRGVESRVTWENHLPGRHILPWDPTLSTAKLPPGSAPGIPTVVHLHGAVAAPGSDGNSMAWFTRDYNATGPAWSAHNKEYVYPNVQTAGNLWYHDHAMGLTRVNLLAGLVGAYVIRDPEMEEPLGLPSGPEFDRHLVVFDRSFARDGSIYMNPKGNNPAIHPQWQPEYFGDAIVVNGKAWPVMKVRRRTYRFRIINASNARFFRFYFLLTPNSSTTRGMLRFVHIGSDNAYLAAPAATNTLLLAPSEIADVLIDFARTHAAEAILANNASYPFPKGDQPIAEETNGRVMKFVIQQPPPSPSPSTSSPPPPTLLMRLPLPDPNSATPGKRRIVMYEYTTPEDEPTHLYLNFKPFSAPATETPRPGTTERWDVINLTDDNHPFHIHLAHFVVLEQRRLLRVPELRDCMNRTNDADSCHVDASHAVGLLRPVPRHESGWKNVFKMRPRFVTRILVRFALLAPLPTNVVRNGRANANSSSSYDYPFDPTADPGYVYHCHILDHEDNEMMRPLKLVA